MPHVEDDERAAAILGRQAKGLLALDEALVELADANCVVTIAGVIANHFAGASFGNFKLPSHPYPIGRWRKQHYNIPPSPNY